MKRINRPIPELGPKDVARFWAKVAKGERDECWNWTACRKPSGYGCFAVGPKTNFYAFMSTRVAYKLHYGVEPGQLLVCHRCDNPNCCNPHHLFLGTNSDNMSDMVQKGRAKFICGEKHPFAILTAEQVREMRTRRQSEGLSYRELSAIYGISYSVVGGIITRNKWSHVT